MVVWEQRLGLGSLVAKAHSLDQWVIRSGGKKGGANLRQVADECGFPNVTMQSSELGVSQVQLL